MLKGDRSSQIGKPRPHSHGHRPRKKYEGRYRGCGDNSAGTDPADCFSHKSSGAGIRALKVLLEVSRINLEKQNYRDTIQKTTDAIIELLNFESSALYLLKDEKTIKLIATTPPLPPDFPDYFRTADLANHPHIGNCIRTASPVFLYDIREEIKIAAGRSLKSFLYLPLVYEEKVTGVLITGNQEPVQLPEHTIESCVSLANIAFLTISNAELYRATRQKVLELEK